MGRDESPLTRFRRALAATRSGLRRYPRDLTQSITSPVRPAAPVAGRRLDAIHEHDPFAASWLGHASVLLRQGATNILLDPVFSRRIGLRVGPLVFGPHRLTEPITPDALPPIDLILISHAHFDHLDRPSLNALLNPRTNVIVPRGVRRLIPRGFRHIIELDWGKSITLSGVEITAHVPEHWGARAAVDRQRRYNAYAIRGDTHATFFSGDTASTDAFDHIKNIDLAVFGIGAYDPWEHKHATPEQVWTMFSAMNAARLLPVHHSTFELSDEAIDEPLERLITIAGDEHPRIVRADQGQLWTPQSP
ncbi:MAG: MBL fold metallo-hydrolase [Phycisphaerales bacterium JB059]